MNLNLKKMHLLHWVWFSIKKFIFCRHNAMNYYDNMEHFHEIMNTKFTYIFVRIAHKVFFRILYTVL